MALCASLTRQGNDGGSIAKRDDLVRTKAAAEKQDQDEVRHILWTACRLSKNPLREPVLADSLGQMFNKDAILECLLRRSAGAATDHDTRTAGHIRGMKVRRRGRASADCAGPCRAAP